jgi:hypothetical protein
LNAKPRRHLSDINYDTMESEHKGPLKEVYSQDGMVIIECEVQQPPSMKGRTVYVWFQDDDLLDVLKLLRDEAINVRSKAMES